MAGSPPIPAEAPPSPAPGVSPPGPPTVEAPSIARGSGAPLLIDRTDLRLGTTVQFDRIPTASELHDLTLLPGLAHIVLSLPAWPAEYAPLDVLNQAPEEADVVVVLPGYPPNRAAAEVWNYLRANLRIVVIVAGPPPSNTVVSDLNAMRRLERVIAQMDEPSRSGFERLQRPLSFRKLME